MAFFLRGAMRLYENDLKSKTPLSPLEEEIIELPLCSSLGKKHPEI